ncbi:unnamed protein product [Parascedosporium putredinis]|uniref:Uncharacterized protein n=1 Tax=Parascedosporium putredinis TaxID=1442378 RepID=A0A9P1GV62_9PEZI|nr:unnamed protein product [Parascedosporium putredinis]CAI7987665.1 unnamed protein product [Parascedosporium putredinis]
MKFTAAALLALAATVAADTIKFTRASPGQLGMLRRQEDGGYEPEVRECGDGNTCAEACGAGYEQCDSDDTSNHCFNPSAGETCCRFLGLGSSCNAGYFCAHDSDKNTVCCGEGKSLEECAALNDSGALVSDVPVTSTAEPTASETGASNSTATLQPSSTRGVVFPESGAANFVPAAAAALLAVGAFAALL